MMDSKAKIEVKVDRVEGTTRKAKFGSIEIVTGKDGMPTEVKINGVVADGIVSLDIHVDAFNFPTVKMEVYEQFYKTCIVGGIPCHAKVDEKVEGAVENEEAKKAREKRQLITRSD